MSAYAILVVNQHMESLLAEAAHERLVRQLPNRSLRDRVASAIRSLRTATADPADAALSVPPAAERLPYRS